MAEIAISAKEGKTPAAQEAARARRRRLVASIVIGSILVHLAAIAVFGVWVIAQYFTDPPAEFEVREIVRIPPQTREHKMNMAAHEAMAPKPTFSDRILSQRPMQFALPDLPQVPIDQMLPLDPSDLISDQVNSMLGMSGLGSGRGGGAAGGGGSGDWLAFFGIKDEARSVVIMIDVSASMFGRTGDLDYGTGKLLREGKEQSFQAVREEAFKLIDGLGIDTTFGIIRWSGSARVWKDRLVPATTANKQVAKKHIQEEVDANTAGPRGGRPGGTRHDYALEALFELNPEVAFMLSDGNATASDRGGATIPEDELLDIVREAKTRGELPRIHTIYYVTGKDVSAEERMLKAISRRTKGKSRKVQAGKPK